MRWVLLTSAGWLAGCFAPSAPAGAPCSADFACPGTQRCNRDVSPPICDGVTSDAAAVDAAPLGAWRAPTMVMMPVGDEDDPTLTGDLLEMHFNRNQVETWRVTRGSAMDAWGVPEPMLELDPSTTPKITRDGRTIYIGSRRSGGLGSDDIWVSTRATRDAAWSAPVLVTELSSGGTDTNATPADDDLTLVMVRRTGPQTGPDVYTAIRAATSDVWGAPMVIDAVTSPQSDGDPMLSSDGLELYFYSTRTAGGDLYVAKRAKVGDPFGPPEPIAELNTNALDQDPWISPDGRHLFFASDRDGPLAIYESTR